METNDKGYRLFMSHLTPVLDNEGKEVHLCQESENTKITLVYSERFKCRCALRVCKKTDASVVYKNISKVSDNNVLKVYDVVLYNGDTYVLAEFLEGGGTLQQILDEHGLFTPPETYKIISEVCSGLKALHKQKPPVLHGDIKPSNIWHKLDGSVKLFDFDISRLENKKADTNTKHAYTVGFSAPEQINHLQPTTPRSDIYSVGATMHYMLTGELVHKNSKCKRPLKGVIDKCTKIDPKDRYRSVDHLLRAMRFARNKRKIVLFSILILIFVFLLLWGVGGNFFGASNGVGETTPLSGDYFVEQTEGEYTRGEANQNIIPSTEKQSVSDSQMKIAYNSESAIIKTIGIGEGKYVVFEWPNNEVKLTFSDGRKVVFNQFDEGYKQDVFFNHNKNELYVFSYNEKQLKVYRVEQSLTLTELSSMELNLFVDKHNEEYARDKAHFLANGYMIFEPAYLNNLFDIENWCEVGNIKERYFHSNITLGDKLYNYSEKGLEEYDYSGRVVNDISINGLKSVYTDGKKIYCLCIENETRCIKSYDGKKVSVEYTFEGVDAQTITNGSKLCITDSAIVIYTDEFVKEYKR